MRLKSITGNNGLGSQYNIVYEFKDYDNNTIGIRKVRNHGYINQQYWYIERKGYEEWWYGMLNECDKSFNI